MGDPVIVTNQPHPGILHLRPELDKAVLTRLKMLGSLEPYSEAWLREDRDHGQLYEGMLMNRYLIIAGTDNDMTIWDADSPKHAIEQASEIGLESRGEINEVLLCVPIQNAETTGTVFAFSRDGSYFGAGDLEVAVVDQATLDQARDGEVDLEHYLKDL